VNLLPAAFKVYPGGTPCLRGTPCLHHTGADSTAPVGRARVHRAFLSSPAVVTKILEHITRTLELQHIAAKMKTVWGQPLRALSVELQMLVLTMEFFQRHGHVVNDATWIHMENVLEQVELNPGRRISRHGLLNEVARNPGVFEYFAGLGADWESGVDALDTTGLLRDLVEVQKIPPLRGELATPEQTYTCMSLARELFDQCHQVQLVVAERRAMGKLQKAGEALTLQQKREQKELEKCVRSGHWYRLCNTHGVLENNLVYSHRERTGVNLAWKRTRPNIQFIPEKAGPVLRHGMPFSIRVDHLDGDVRTLSLKSQRAGIQLGRYPATDVSYEWVIWGKPVGTPVKNHELFMIRNVRVAGNLHRSGGYLNYTELPGDVVNLAFGDHPLPEWCVLP